MDKFQLVAVAVQSEGRGYHPFAFQWAGRSMYNRMVNGLTEQQARKAIFEPVVQIRYDQTTPTGH
jgi:hypothetical protein